MAGRVDQYDVARGGAKADLAGVDGDALVALGLAVDSTVARRPELVMLLWVRALLPGVMCAAYLFAPVRAVPARALAREG